MPTFFLAWDASTDPNTVGYRGKTGQQSGAYTITKDFGNVLDGSIEVSEGGWYAVVVALNAGGQESTLTNEVFQNFPITAPGVPALMG